MSDESTTDDRPDATDEIPSPPPGESPAPPRLRRSDTDRMAAGVCGGIAEYFGIDPIIARLGFVVLTLIGGSGIAIYLIAWLVMPAAWEDESAALNALRGGRRAGGRSLLALALLILAIVVFSGSAFWFPSVGDGLFLPLLILAAGVALLVWPADGVAWHGRWHADNEEWRNERDAIRSEWRTERDAWRQSRRGWRHGYRRGFTPSSDTPPSDGAPPSDGTPSLPPPRPHRRRERRPRPRPFLGPLAIAALLLYAGLTVLADRVDWWSTDPGAFLAICLVIIGAVLVASAFVGRARGLIWLGALLLPLAWAWGAADLTWWDGIGEEQVTVVSADELEDEYRWGIGQYHVDLSDLDLDGRTRAVAIGLTIGELKIWVPETLAVDIDLDGRIGSVIVSESALRTNDDGMDVSLDRTSGEPTDGSLVLDIDVGIGEAEVVVCGSEALPCP